MVARPFALGGAEPARLAVQYNAFLFVAGLLALRRHGPTSLWRGKMKTPCRCLRTDCGIGLSGSNSLGWGAVTGPRGGAAYRGPMGGAAVRGPAVARGPAGGVAARGPNGGAAYRGPYGGTAVRGAYEGTTVVAGGVYRPSYGAGAVAAGVAVGVAAGAAAASTYCPTPPYCYPAPCYNPPPW